jgi:hypothetical protein
MRHNRALLSLLGALSWRRGPNPTRSNPRCSISSSVIAAVIVTVATWASCSGLQMGSDRSQLRAEHFQLRADHSQLRSDRLQLRSDRLQLRSDRLELRSPIFPNVTQNLTLLRQFDRNSLGLDLNSSSKPTFCEAKSKPTFCHVSSCK